MGYDRDIDLTDLILSSERLTLRPWRLSDVPAVHEAMQDRPTHEFLTLPDPYGESDAVEFVTEYAASERANGKALSCALVETASGQLVGSADLKIPAPRRTSAEIGYVIYAPARGRGYATEASRALTEWAFAHGIGRVEIRCALPNLASAKSALNAGFRYEGTLRGDVQTPAGLADGAVFGRVAGSPNGPPSPPRFPALPADGLTDGVLAIRTLRPSDAAALHAQAVDPLTVDFGFSRMAPTFDEMASRAARAGLDWLVGLNASFAMVEVATDRVAGSLMVRLPGPPDVGGLGYAVHPDFRGRGYTTRALRLLVPWAFDVAGFARLELGAKTSNVASLRAAERAGFLPDGVLRARLRNPDGSFADEARFALVNPRLRSAG
jgi:RimJ/RimL family protein N-acetyltransferase